MEPTSYGMAFAYNESFVRFVEKTTQFKNDVYLSELEVSSALCSTLQHLNERHTAHIDDLVPTTHTFSGNIEMSFLNKTSAKKIPNV